MLAENESLCINSFQVSKIVVSRLISMAFISKNRLLHSLTIWLSVVRPLREHYCIAGVVLRSCALNVYPRYNFFLKIDKAVIEMKEFRISFETAFR